MGHFRVDIDAVGGHGCQRELKSGAMVPGCGKATCPDCAVRELVMKLKQLGCFNHSPAKATIRHWPGQKGEVIDDLLTEVREGSF